MTAYFPKYKSLFSTTLSTGIGTGTGETITPASVSGVPTDAQVTITINRVNSGGTVLPAAGMERIRGTISAGNLINYTRGVDSTTDQAHLAGEVIEIIFNASDWNLAVDGLLVEHDQDGTHDTALVTKLAGAQTFTGAKTFTTGLLKAVDVTSGAGVSTFPTTTDTLVARTTTDTLTNKRVTARVGTVADAATVTPTGDSSDVYTVTALAQAATIAAPSGTPTNGQKLLIRFLDNGTARALTWNSIYVVVGTTLPTTTTLSKYTYVGCVYNSASSKWDVLAVATQA